MIFLNTCRICGRELVGAERMICLRCVADFPLWEGSADDLRAHRLPRTLPIAKAVPWLVYSNNNPVCEMLRAGKFNDRPELISELARRFARHLAETDALAGIDALVPVPMHWWKKMRRGYNQTELIAEEISRACGVRTVKALKALRTHAVQSRRSGAERATNVAGIFGVDPRADIAPGSRIAIVDDILTTGATLSEAASALMALKPRDITVLSLAATRII